MKSLPFFCLLFSIQFLRCLGQTKEPSVFISILVRNKAHTLPYFLTQLYALDYPKDRITLHIRSHHNVDNSLEILEAWLNNITNNKEYHNIIKEFYPCKGDCLLEGEKSPVGWFDTKFTHIMNLRQQALTVARFSWADFFWSLDSDVLLTDLGVLQFLVQQNHTVSAPVLPSIGRYSNFWGGMSETYYYQRTPEYSTILDRGELGCFKVPMVHSSVLVDLRTKESDLVSYNPEHIKEYPGPHDDIIVFALSCRLNNIPMHICNQREFGTIMMPLEDDQDLSEDLITLTNTLVQISVKSEPIIPDPIFKRFLPQPTTKGKVGLDEIYMINLDRRPDRKQRMDYNFHHLGLDYRHFAAVDGRVLGPEYLLEEGINMLPGFSEPYHGRPLKMGEVGCFMSHYNLWKDIVEKKYDMVLIFEDDIRFEPFFISKLENLLKELRLRRDDWDLVFLGRKRSKNAEEPWAEGSDQLVQVGYTYWTLAYILSGEGARKLLAGKPLDKMLPVDEYIPIMYNRHPNTTWANFFSPRNLKALSVEPLMVYPTHYTGEQGYISDTEGTSIIDRQAKPQDDIFTEHDGDQNQNGCEATDGICTKDEL